MSFPKAGDPCQKCAERWEKADKPLVPLVALPGFTMCHHSEVTICRYCDGPINEIAIAAAQKREKDAASS